MGKIDFLLKAKTAKYLKYAQPIFYVAFLFLWFKDNFYSFKKINIHYLVPLIPLTVIILSRLFLNYRFRKIHLSFKINKSFLAIIALIVLVTAIRIPFLVYNYSLASQPDEGVSALMGKHIS